MKRFFPLVLFLLAAGCQSLSRPPAEPVHVVIVGTTDVHGWFNGHVETPPGGGQGVVWGGLPALAAYIEALREDSPGRVLLVDSGDMFQGTLESNLFEGEAVVRGYNAIGYAAAAIGNHEFDFGPVGPEVIARKPNEDPLGALKRNAEIAMFPLLSANMVEKATGRTPSWAKRYTMVRAGRARIGIVGLSTPDTPNVTMSMNVESLLFTDPVAATVESARELREQGADAVIVIAHMGGRCTKNTEPHSLESCDRNAEAMALLEKLPAGTIDAFFAGHTHANMRHYVNGVPAAQGLDMSREFSTIDLWVDVANDRVIKSDIRPHTMICTFVYEGTDRCDPRTAPKGAQLVPRVYSEQTMEPDTRVALAVEPFLRRVAAKREEKVGITASASFSRAYLSESPLGNLLADALRRYSGADVALMNSGGIRAELPEGELTYGHIFAVSPFDNYPTMVILSGAQLVELLRATSTGIRGIMQVSGVRYTIDASKKGLERFQGATLADGSPIIPDKLYTVMMPDFIAMGGDGADLVMKDVPADRIQVTYAAPLRDVIIEQLKGRSIDPKVEERITVLNQPRRAGS
ncbi:MAG TPA: 5'-nucleotidase C-terminal domain-containing protein [Thermoanaerobaculia bacterium]|nr:5'-nucleotidase C-terminal domain-containing protein [Thermoanaerobaculia bacterium]